MFQYIPPPAMLVDPPAEIREIEDNQIVNITGITESQEDSAEKRLLTFFSDFWIFLKDFEDIGKDIEKRRKRDETIQNELLSKPFYADYSPPPISELFFLGNDGNFIHGAEELSNYIKKQSSNKEKEKTKKEISAISRERQQWRHRREEHSKRAVERYKIQKRR